MIRSTRRIDENVDYVADFKIEKNQIDIYPNPASDVIYIDLDKSFDATIYNYQGQIVKKINVENGQVCVSDLPNGIYFFEVKTEDHVYVKKIVLR